MTPSIPTLVPEKRVKHRVSVMFGTQDISDFCVPCVCLVMSITESPGFGRPLVGDDHCIPDHDIPG